VTTPTWTRVVAVLLALALAACGSDDDQPTDERRLPGDGRPAVTLGTKNFTEQFILGELYAQALRARGFRVRLKQNIGSSEIIDRTLTGGQIDLYPEYIGVIAVELARAQRRPRTAQETYERARAFERRRGMELLERTPFSDTLALAVKPEYAERHDLEQVGDLRRLKSFRFGGYPENRTRFQGLRGMREVYGLTNARFVPVQIGRQYSELDAGLVDVANVLTTDGQLERGEYVVLEDTRSVFGFQNVAPVVRRDVLARMGPAFARTLDAVSARLTDEAMQAMNGAVEIDRRRPAAVARAFLREQRLLGS
jgi:osmoprotectant transport system substrate-binding protein